MSVLRLSTNVRNARLNALNTALGANATIKLYTGPMAASPDVAATGTLLGTLTCGAAFGTVANGVLTAGAISNDDAADADGVVAWARLATSSGVGVIDVDVTDMVGDGVIKMNTVTISLGGPLQISSFSFTEPA